MYIKNYGNMLPTYGGFEDIHVHVLIRDVNIIMELFNDTSFMTFFAMFYKIFLSIIIYLAH